MSAEKSPTGAQLRVAAGGVVAGSGLWLGGVHDLGLTLGAGCVAGSLGHAAWYHSTPERFRRAIGRDGWTDWIDLMTTEAGAKGLRKRADSIRPALPARPGQWGSRWPLREYGMRLGRLVSGPRVMGARRMYLPWTMPMLVVGPPGQGKSSLLVHGIWDHPGAVYASSTKLELALMTMQQRAAHGPVWVFNPLGLGTVLNTFVWNPVSGCSNERIAEARAWALVRGGGGSKGIERNDFWAQKAQEIIRCYLMAADLRGLGMDAVQYWATTPDDPTPLRILRETDSRVPSEWIGTLESSLAASHQTRTGYFATVTSCVSFMSSPSVAAACKPGAGAGFDIRAFIRDHGTLYVVADDTEVLSPLMTALTEYIFEETRRVSEEYPRNHLPDGLLMTLDEIANTCQVPLPKWSSLGRGHNITIHVGLQADAQLDAVWGEIGARIIRQMIAAKIILPNCGDDDGSLTRRAEAAGKRRVERTTQTHSTGKGRKAKKQQGSTVSHSTSVVEEPVVTASVLQHMPRFHAYVTGVGGHCAIVKFEPGFKRAKREQRRLERSARREARRATQQQVPEGGRPEVLPEPMPDVDQAHAPRETTADER